LKNSLHIRFSERKKRAREKREKGRKKERKKRREIKYKNYIRDGSN